MAISPAGRRRANIPKGTTGASSPPGTRVGGASIKSSKDSGGEARSPLGFMSRGVLVRLQAPLPTQGPSKKTDSVPRTAKQRLAFLKAAKYWLCDRCSLWCQPTDKTWRWTGSGWEHHCGDTWSTCHRARFKTVRFVEGQIETIDRAVETVRKIEQDQSINRARAIELICADWLS
jgi:hypothetical protein